eukprot:COSAG05_NODE_57_length_23291_cov_75.862668_45_plen_106_part_00
MRALATIWKRTRTVVVESAEDVVSYSFFSFLTYLLITGARIKYVGKSQTMHGVQWPIHPTHIVCVLLLFAICQFGPLDYGHTPARGGSGAEASTCYSTEHFHFHA